MALWSLSYEFWYYISFPLLGTALVPANNNLKRVLAALVLVAVMFLCGRGIASYFVLWLMGMLVSTLPLPLSRNAVRMLSPIIWSALFCGGSVRDWQIMECLPLGFGHGLSLLIGSCGCFCITNSLRYVSPTDLLSSSLSNMSYTLYAVHVPILVFLDAWWSPVWRPMAVEVYSAAILLSAMVVSFFAAYMLYRLFEANTGKFRRKLETRLGLYPRPPLVAARD